MLSVWTLETTIRVFAPAPTTLPRLVWSPRPQMFPALEVNAMAGIWSLQALNLTGDPTIWRGGSGLLGDISK